MLDDQWNVISGMGGAFYLSLKSEAVKAELDMLLEGQKKWRKKRRKLRNALRHIEKGALSEINHRD